MPGTKPRFIGSGKPNILTNEQVIADEQKTIAGLKEVGLDARYLMGNAAQACHLALTGDYPDIGEYWIFCGKGNNGGDGLALAAILAQKGHQVTTILCMWAGAPDYTEPALSYYNWLQKLAAIHDHLTIVSFKDFTAKKAAHKKLMVVDALLGTGFSPPLQGEAEAVVSAMNDAAAKYKAPLISLDIPSGVSGNGAVGALYTQAAGAYSFHSLKPGLFIPELAGTLTSARGLDIAIEHAVFASALGPNPGSPAEKIEYLIANPKRLLPAGRWYVYQQPDIQQLAARVPAALQREDDGHKYRHGAALVVAGGGATEGAFELLQSAFFAAGGGIMTAVAMDDEAYERRLKALPFIIHTKPQAFLDDLPTLAGKYQSLVVGPGVIPDTETEYFLKELWRRLAELKTGCKLKTIVADAASLTSLAGVSEFITRQQTADKFRLLLTPHSGELAALWQATIKSDTFTGLIPEAGLPGLSLFARCQILAAFYGAELLLKGPDTFLFGPEGDVKVWQFNTSHLGVAGSGDILAGVLARLAAVFEDGEELFTASQWLQSEYSKAHSTPNDWLAFLKNITTGEV